RGFITVENDKGSQKPPSKCTRVKKGTFLAKNTEEKQENTEKAPPLQVVLCWWTITDSNR
ncbi:MAG: hypothetical protein UEU47_12260, partial [Oscillospiraceae bacterium]|nr:hypothetical protein [Oscillospiraceae bacterium]